MTSTLVKRFSQYIPLPVLWRWALTFVIMVNVNPTSAQVVINEYVPANTLTVIGGETNDWIELYNSGNTAVNLNNYGLSDDPAKPYQFRFPDYTLGSHNYVLVFPNDHNNSTPVHHWETAVNASTTWKYFVGTSQPDTNWRNLSFNDAAWSSGPGGFGYGDNDDATQISTSARSVMMRKTFTIPDTSDILKAILDMDYDDGFVAYLNGTEIMRVGIGVVGDRPLYNDLATSSHEAEMFQGGSPDSFYFDEQFIRSIIRQGTNVLAVEVHNVTSSSNDLTAKPYLSFGMATSGLTFSLPPSWFGTPPQEFFTAKFKLSRNGETIYLSDPNNVIDQQTYPSMQPNNSFGRKPDGSSNWCLISNPTAAATNNSSNCYTGYVNSPVFSISPGFYSSSQNVTLSNSTPGGTIRYTTNGDVPTQSSQAYSSPIHITTSTTIRARVFSSGYLPSEVVTNTYIIGDDIHLPVFCITTDYNNLWDYNTGIYVMGPNAQSASPYFGANFWQDWQKPAAIEYYDKSQSRVFSFDADINIFGNYSRAKPQKSMEIRLKDSYGTGELNYSFYSSKPGVDKVNDLVLRNSGTDWNVVHFRDAFMERVLKPTHTGYIAAEPAVMYLNGEYWGVFTIHENHDHHWIENNFHYKEDEVDYMKEAGSTLEIKNGTSDFFFDAYNYATAQNPASSSFYNDMNNYWDLDNYKDYFIAETYYNNHDWIGDWTNNIKMWRPRIAGGKLRYLIYDLDMGCGYTGNVNDTTLYTATHPTAFSLSSNLLNSLLANPRFKQEFVNRYADLINTTFKPSKMTPVLHQFQDSMSHDMPAHFAKWGSTMSNWQSNINSMTSFITNRPAKVRNHIQWYFNFTKQVTLTFDVNPPGAGRIQVSTIIPESLPWTGVYFDGNPVTITAIPNPGFTFNHWDSNHSINNDPNQTTTYNFHNSTESITAFFSGSAQTPEIVVSEFNYNSSSTLDAHDWVELHNYSTLPVNISGWQIKDQDENDAFTFPIGTVIAPNSYLVVVSDTDAFAAAYPAVSNYIGPLGFDFSNSGDQIRLLDNNGALIQSFFYQDVLPWPAQADGQGFTCERVSNTSNPNNASSWFAGCMGGSPGTAYTFALTNQTHIIGNSTFCTGQHTLLTLNSTPGYTYQWQRDHISIPSATDTFYTANQAGAYTVIVSSQGCSGFSDTMNVVVVTTVASPVTANVSRCGQGSVTLSATATDSIYWFDAPNGNVIGTGSTFNTPTINNSTTFYVQASLSCPSAPVPVDVTINPVTETPVCAGPQRCGPGPVVLNATDTAVVHWYNDPTTGALIHTGNQFITGYIPHDTVFYAEAGTGCVSDRLPVVITIVSAAPPVVNNISRCGPGTVFLAASSFSPVFWYDSLIGGTQVWSGVNFITPFLTSTQTYYAEANNGCASARVAADAMINSIPAPPAVTDSFHCGPGSVNLNATANYQILWYSTSTGGTSIGSGGNFATPSISNTTTYYAETFDLCPSSRTPVAAVIESIPGSPSANDAMICGSGSVQLSATSTDSIYWYGQSSGGQVLGTGPGFVTPVINTTTVYYAVAMNNCPSNPTPVTAFVTSIPTTLLGQDTTIQSGDSISLNAGSGYDSYLWSTGDTTQSIYVNNSNTYWVSVSMNGCSQTDSIEVNVVLGIQDVNLFNGTLNIFPNPVGEIMNIRLDSKVTANADMILSDITGKELVYRKLELKPGMNAQTVDVTGFSAGIYLLTFKSRDLNKTVSVIIR
jgi:hypothetical protein